MTVHAADATRRAGRSDPACAAWRGFPDDVDFADLLVQLFLRIRDDASLGMARCDGSAARS